MSDTESKWDIAIGLEVHIQLKTRTKLFSRASNEAPMASPNQNASLVDLAYPGTLPVLNYTAVTQAVRFGVAIDAPIARVCSFDRKNYFYPDLPKGYQISQYSQPIVGAGVFELWLEDGQTKPIRILRGHLEEDAGKSIHDRLPNATVLDFNRAGAPLLEIVTAPDLNSPMEAVACFRQLHALAIWLDLSTGKLNEGAMRCDANVSLRLSGQDNLGTPTELKNLNSFKFLEKALRYEIDRHTKVLSAGQKVQRETRLYDPASGTTQSMRLKEKEEGYRYFIDPDLPPIPISEEFITRIAKSTPELPSKMRERFIKDFGLAPDIAFRLTLEKPLAELFEATVMQCGDTGATANWILGELTALRKVKHSRAQEIPISAKQLAKLILRVEDGTISSYMGKELLRALWDSELDLDQFIQTRAMTQISDSNQISMWVAKVIEENRHLIPKILQGEEKLLEYLIGQVMKVSRGKANPHQVRESLDHEVVAQSKYLSAENSN